MRNNNQGHNNLNKLTEMMNQKYTTEKPGISIMAIKSGNIVYNEQFGLANLEYGIPITAGTVFNVASITKQFTAMAIMLLAEQKRLDYDNKLTDYFPELFHFEGVTIQHLLNNSSGIENYYRILERRNRSAIHITNKEVYQLLKKEKSLLFDPGSKFDYSNSNWVLLAMLVEQISGLTYEKYIEQNIFKKIGMKNSIVFSEKQPIVKNRAYGYKAEDNDIFCDYSEALTVGDGGIFSTIEDLLKWDQALYTDTLVSKESIDLAMTNGLKREGEQYGFGWNVDVDYYGNKKVWHTGLDAGFRSVITRYIDKEFTVIILSNSSECTWEERQKITEKLYMMLND